MDNLNEPLKNKFVIMLMGQTGRGKSSTINTLLGTDIAPVNDDEPETMSVEVYDTNINGTDIQVVDTPGLCDALPEEQNDRKYIDLVKGKIKVIDCLWFVSRLDETRVTSDEKRAIRIITEAFGSDVWKYAVIVFTFSGNVKEENFYSKLETRTRLIKKEIEIWAGESNSSDVQSVAIDNMNQFLPNGKEWLGELYTQTFLRLKEDSAAAFLLATADRVKITEIPTSVAYNGQSGVNINLNENQAKIIKRHVSKSEWTGGAIGAALGATVAGPFGAFMGFSCGAIAGRFLNWITGGK